MPAEADLDRVFERIRGLAEQLALPCTTSTPASGSPTLAISEQSFVHLLDEHTLVLHCPIEQKILLMDISPDIYFETDHYIGQNLVLIRLDVIDDEELGLRIEDAWRFKAPEKASRQGG